MDGRDILRARQAANISQAELSDALGLTSRGTLTDIESGTVEVTPGWALKVIGICSGIAANRSLQK